MFKNVDILLLSFHFQGYSNAETDTGETSAGYVNKNVSNKEDLEIKQQIDDAQNTIKHVSCNVLKYIQI